MRIPAPIFRKQLRQVYATTGKLGMHFSVSFSLISVLDFIGQHIHITSIFPDSRACSWDIGKRTFHRHFLPGEVLTEVPVTLRKYWCFGALI
jgi:hypothetical protein